MVAKIKLLIMIILTVFVLSFSNAIAQNLQVHIIDVGEGNCTLIISPTGRTLMFDAGQIDQADNIWSYLNSIGINHLNYFIPSHYHADHIGGMAEGLMNYVTVDTVYDRAWEYCTWIYDDYASLVSSIRHTITDGQVIDLGGGATITCLGLNGNGQLSPPYIADNCDGGSSNDENDFCVAIRLDYNDFQFYAAGDLSGYNTSKYSDIETSIGADCGDVDVYLVDHHGSRYSSNPTFLNELDPEVSIISVGQNSYGHPHPETIDRLNAIGTAIYQTEDGYGNIIDGDIVLNTTGYDFYTVEGDTFPLAPSAPGDTISIADIQDNYEQYAGQDVIVKGFVTLGAGITNPYITDAYIEDSSGKGINLFDINLLGGIDFGNLIAVDGTVDENAGTTQLVDITNITVFDENQYVWDTPFSTGDANDITWEGTRMWVGGTAESIVDNGNSKTITINDGSGDLALNISDFAGVDISDYSVGDFVNAYGVCDVGISGGDTTYQVIVGYQPDISNSPYTVKMIPDDTPIEILSSGGSFYFTGILRNNTSNNYNVDVWIMLKLPSGAFYGPLNQFNNVPLSAYQSYNVPNVSQVVPSGAPLGDYEYWVYAGDYPSIKSDSNMFPFRVVPSTAHSNNPVNIAEKVEPSDFVGNGWVSYGWDKLATVSGNGCSEQAEASVMEAETLTAYNSPNPFNPQTTINYILPTDGRTTLKVYNILGREVKTLIDENQQAGPHNVVWDGTGNATGIYYYYLRFGGTNIVGKMLLIK